MPRFKVILDNVLVRKKAPDSFSNIIFIPEPYQDRSRWGTVFQTGNKVKHLKYGDEVYIPHHEGVHITINGVPYVIIKEQLLIDKSVLKVPEVEKVLDKVS